MKSLLGITNVIYALFVLFALNACNNSDPTSPSAPVINPFSNGGTERNMIVILSDMHLGADLTYAECKNNVPHLEKLIKQIKVSPNVKEIVIAGDLIDEWFVPAPVNTYQGGDQLGFVSRLASANSGVFAALNSIIQEGLILVTYVPGNHDIAITAASIQSVLPGINQVRDNVLGLGTYSPAGLPKIAIEHGHRYNFFCAPDPISNQTIAPGTIMPPGYFFTRIGALASIQGNLPPGDTTPVVYPNTSGGTSQDLLYRYWKDWYMTLNMFPISNRFDENLIVTNMNGFTGTFKVNDLVPYQLDSGGFINVNLYNGAQDNWESRQTHNNVPVHIDAPIAIDSVNSDTYTDYQASMQYFMNPNSNKRLVVFGHTHIPKISVYQNYINEKCIYANSGTWIDNNPNLTSMHFVVITPQDVGSASQTLVKLYNFENEVVTKMNENSLRF
ncbi:MAG: metallophosphoesterase [Ignavibacteriae bacterium]|nr:metallophosphoesterase [Ignavibacteriota bacterium]